MHEVNTILLVNTREHLLLPLVLGLGMLLSACGSDLTSAPEPEVPKVPINPSLPDTNGTASNGSLTLSVGDGTVALQEGAGAISVPITVQRTAVILSNITLSVQGLNDSDEYRLSRSLEDTSLSSGEDSTQLTLSLDYDTFPISAHERQFQISASYEGSSPLSVLLNVAVQPTDKPDVYLIAGQSNAVGSSELGAKRSGPGEPDEPSQRVSQLNVTGNDGSNFATASDYTDPNSVYVTGQALAPAEDPLHDGFDTTNGGKAGTRIGFGLAFAKHALQSTTTDIYLVPTAWSDTGFCKRKTNRLPGSGWNATQKNNAALSGTLLHDRAVARANVALEKTNGILRGILWHQGEADSDEMACAQTYQANLKELAESLRTRINVDARGQAARGPNADIPFIVGTMSKGSNEAGDMLPFSEAKQLVDTAHRSISTYLTMSSFVNNDDLVPSAYPCGEGSCIHFGATALREMGHRYFMSLNNLRP